MHVVCAHFRYKINKNTESSSVYPLLNVDAHDGEVVVGLGTVAMFVDGGDQGLNHLARRVVMSIAQDTQQPVVAELLLPGVLGFVDTVSIDE